MDDANDVAVRRVDVVDARAAGVAGPGDLVVFGSGLKMAGGVRRASTSGDGEHAAGDEGL